MGDVKKQIGIIATCFGGSGDLNKSAYGGYVNPFKLGVALPYRFREKPIPQVIVYYKNGSAVCDIVDVGPHYTNNPYWRDNERPQAESVGGNKAGIDLTPAVFAALAIKPSMPEYGLVTVDWEFKPTTEDNQV